jgi:excinuclease ABC subunit C
MIEVKKDEKFDSARIPTNPGIYIYKNENQEIIYIGKAKNLRSRVKSYFLTFSEHSVKTQVLVSKIRFVDFIIVNNEVEALILENNLIKKHSPRYNITLKDAKTYAYIKITNERFPRIMSTRKVENDGGKYFGPYTDGFLRRELIRLISLIYKIRICEKFPKKPCLQYQMDLCSGPCADESQEEDYNKRVKSAIELLKGNTDEALEFLQKEMSGYSKRKEYEKAMLIKRKIESVEAYFTKQNVDRIKRYDEDVAVIIENGAKALITMFGILRGTILGKREYEFDYTPDVFEEFIKMYYSSIDAHKIPSEILVNKISGDEKQPIELFLSKLKGSNVSIIIPQRGEKANLVELAIKNAEMNLTENSTLLEIKKNLNLDATPTLIECFDISNLGYEHLVAAMVRFTNAKPDKKEYRKFLIRSVQDRNDDFASMREVIYRRYFKLREEKSQMPNLIIIDGGKGQLSSALESLKLLGLDIPIIGLAKENEEIYLPEHEDSLIFKKNSKMMLLIRQIRDETHRFVITYNKKRREMKTRQEFKDVAKERKKKERDSKAK